MSQFEHPPKQDTAVIQRLLTAHLFLIWIPKGPVDVKSNLVKAIKRVANTKLLTRMQVT